MRDALATEAALAARGAPTMLHHSRYALHDRTLLDTRLMRLLGPGGVRTPIAVIATQTAEQSLDIDADVLVTDACPADVLLQRLGRLHRHRTGTAPTALMIDPGPLERYLSADGRVRGQEGQGWAWVYCNLLAVHETLAAVRESGSVTVPDDCRTLVERSTHADHLRDTATELGPAWLALWRRLYMEQGRQEALAEGRTIDWSLPYDRASVVDNAVTRLGEGTVDVTVRGLHSPFDGARIDTLPVPARWLRGVAPGTVAMADGDEIRIGAARLRYDARGLQREG